MGFIESALEPVDPAEAQGHLDRLGIGDRRHALAHLGKLEPQPGLVLEIALQPLLERLGVLEAQDRRFRFSHGPISPLDSDIRWEMMLALAPRKGLMSTTFIPIPWVAQNFQLPTVCARHGKPATFHAPARVEGRVSWLAIFLIVGFIVLSRKYITAPALPFCDECRVERRKRVRAALVRLGLGVAAIIAGVVLTERLS